MKKNQISNVSRCISNCASYFLCICSVWGPPYRVWIFLCHGYICSWSFLRCNEFDARAIPKPHSLQYEFSFFRPACKSVHSGISIMHIHTSFLIIIDRFPFHSLTYCSFFVHVSVATSKKKIGFYYILLVWYYKTVTKYLIGAKKLFIRYEISPVFVNETISILLSFNFFFRLLNAFRFSVESKGNLMKLNAVFT